MIFIYIYLYIFFASLHLSWVYITVKRISGLYKKKVKNSIALFRRYEKVTEKWISNYTQKQFILDSEMLQCAFYVQNQRENFIYFSAKKIFIIMILKKKTCVS